MEHQIPNVVVRFHLPKRWHAAQPNAVFDNPEKLLIGIGLRLSGSKVGGTRVHPPARIRGNVAAVSMTSAALRAKQPLAFPCACLTVRGRWWNAFAAAAPVNKIVLRSGGKSSFNASWFGQ
jgi:hypothetical protein